MRFALSWMCPALVLLLALSLAACDNSGQKASEQAEKQNAAGEKPLAALLLYKGDDAYVSLVGKELSALLADRVRLVTLSADYDQLVQNEQLDRVIADGAGVLMLNLVESQSAALVLDKIRKAGLPVVFFNREPDLMTLESYRGKACFVGTNVEDAGKLQGEIIAGLWEKHPEYDRDKDGKLQFVMFQGDPDNPEAVARTEYSVRQAQERGVALEQLGQSFLCAWDKELAAQSMAMALAEYGTRIELVIANNDAMALGAVQALNQAGWNLPGDKERHLPVVGVDAIPEAVAAVKDGRMSATVIQDAKAMAKAVAALALNALEGKDFLEGTAYAWDGAAHAVRIPYAPFGGEE